MKYMVDTDAAIDYLHGQRSAVTLLRTLAMESSERLGISLATYGELLAGVRYSRDPQRTEHAIRQFLRLVEIIPITQPIMRRFAEIKAELSHQGQVIGDFDTLIAATAVERDLILVTQNRRHFGRVSQLMIYQSR